jgi:hypothetical protein
MNVNMTNRSRSRKPVYSSRRPLRGGGRARPSRPLSSMGVYFSFTLGDFGVADGAGVQLCERIGCGGA